ncbi:MAG: DUF2339 domain-containing protein [Janthinobacterium lividum]
MFDDLVFYLFLLAGVILSGWVLAIAAFVQARRARAEIRQLRAALALSATAGAGVQAASLPASPPRAAPPPGVAPLQARDVVPPPPVAPAKPRIDWEQALTQRWGVWAGAAALLLAGVFLVRTAVESGWLGPAPRCAIAAVLGALLALGAEWLRRRSPPSGALTDQAPAALAAGAVGAWLAGAYAAGPLYQLVPDLAAFTLMAAASLAGLALSLRFGPLVGAVGLAAAFGTPVLVGLEDLSIPGLFGYLLIVSAAAWAVVRFTAWTWLGWAAAVAGVAWVVAFALDNSTESAWAPSLFVPAAAGLSLLLLPGAALDHPVGRRLSWAPTLVLGLAGLLLAVATADSTARMGVLLLAPVTVSKGWAEPRLARLPQLAAGLMLLVLLTWALPTWHTTGEAITVEGAVQAILPGAWAPEALLPFLETAAAMATWFAGAGLFLERRSPRPLPWAALPAAVPVLVLVVAYVQAGRFQSHAAWAAAAMLLAAGLTAAAALAQREGSLPRAGAHAAGVAAALALGAAILLSDAWLTLALALLLPALAWIEGVAGVPLRRVALAVAGVVLVRLVLNPYVLGYEVGGLPVLNGLLLAYGVPAACFAVAATLFRRQADDLVVAVLEGGALAFVAALVLLQVHHTANGGLLGLLDPTFGEAAAQVDALGLLALGTAWLHGRMPRPVLRMGWRILGGAGLAGGTALILLNPALTNAAVGAGLVWNALLPAYLIPALLAVLAMRLTPAPRPPLAAFAGVAGFAWATLQVRQAFHPGRLSVIVNDPMTDPEAWAYSGAWLLLGAVLMAAGLRTGQRPLRLAALGLVGLVTAKVFLLDMSDLQGLWRVLSFLGLGLSLIGLGAFYRRFVQTAPAV